MSSSRSQSTGNAQRQPPHAEVARNVTQALLNPYSQQQFHLPYSAHYANAYAYAAHTTPEGYTLSSTYDPRTYMPAYNQSFTPRNPPKGQNHNPRPNPTRTPHHQSGSWYQSGNMRCTYERCTFTGSAKSVEIHMMDRHLIYPPGWNKRKGSDWDADPSLKGKTIPIQGTSITLNTQEALDAWIDERRKRWPTSQRVEEKKVKMEEAIARGQLPLLSSGSRGRKRPRTDYSNNQQVKKRKDRRDVHYPNEQKGVDVETKPPSKSLPCTKDDENESKPLVSHVKPCSDGNDSNTDDEAPEVVSSKAPTTAPSTGDTTASSEVPKDNMDDPVHHPKNTMKSSKSKIKEPKLPPRNPFASRPTLLRNLLLPEIRVTISNLSQAIRFLVDNGFLRDVELKPGQADHKLIEVVDSKPIVS